MDAKDIQKWQQEKAKELFDYSHKLLDAAKDLSAHHIAEMEWGMKNAMDSAKSAAKNDLEKTLQSNKYLKVLDIGKPL